MQRSVEGVPGSTGVLRLIWFAAIGAIVATGAEWLHLLAGVWSLRAGGSFPVWVPAVYLLGLLGFAAAAQGIDRILPGRGAAEPPRAGRVDIVAGVALYVVPMLAHGHELALGGVAAAYLAARLAWTRRAAEIALVALTVAAVVSVEAAATGAGLYGYPDAGFFRLPLWLAPVWGGFALALRRVVLWLTRGSVAAAEHTPHERSSA